MFERLREDIQSVFHRDPAARNAFEVLTCYPGMHAIWIHRLSALLWGADRDRDSSGGKGRASVFHRSRYGYRHW